MRVHMKNGIYKFHYCSNDAKVSFTRERAVKDNSVIFSSVSSLKIRINIMKNPKSCTIYEYSQVLKIWDLEILKCSCGFLISNTLLLNWNRLKLKNYLRLLCGMTAGKCLLRSEFPKCPSLFPVSIGSYLKLYSFVLL